MIRCPELLCCVKRVRRLEIGEHLFPRVQEARGLLLGAKKRAVMVGDIQPRELLYKLLFCGAVGVSAPLSTPGTKHLPSPLGVTACLRPLVIRQPDHADRDLGYAPWELLAINFPRPWAKSRRLRRGLASC